MTWHNATPWYGRRREKLDAATDAQRVIDLADAVRSGDVSLVDAMFSAYHLGLGDRSTTEAGISGPHSPEVQT